MLFYLAPMEGITGYIVRNAYAHYFPYIDKYFTPFIPAAKKMSKKIKRDLAAENNEQIRLVPQLIGNRADEFLMMIRQLEDLGFIGNCTKRTAYHTLTAGYTFLIVDHGSSQMIRCDSSNTAGSLTGTLFVTNCIIRADFTAFSALNAFLLINNRLAVFHRDRALGTDTLAGMCQASHA